MGNRNLSDLSLEECREQVRLCWEHFRCCRNALFGENVEPVSLFGCEELGDSDDLELFYACKEIGANFKNQEMN